MESLWEVIVGNIGNVYSSNSGALARGIFDIYVEQSKSSVGRAGNETVTLMFDGEVVTEHYPLTGND